MKFIPICLSFILLLAGCKETYTPKPRGYFRIDFPEKQYMPIDQKYPYQFEIPEYATIEPDYRNPDQPSWINILFPANKAEVHISYYELRQSNTNYHEHLAELLEETRELAYKHSVKANAIDEQLYLNPDEKVFGILYRIEGNVASPMQFFLTDSTTHFLRGAFYIRATPDIDSLKPVVEFLEKDVINLIETTSWE